MDLNARRVMACVGALQGLALWMLVDRWPDDPRVAPFSIAAASFVLVSALVLHFARGEDAYARLLALAVGTALLFAALAFDRVAKDSREKSRGAPVLAGNGRAA